jgi:kynurenine formamidase
MGTDARSKWVFLSYPLDETTPAYGGGESFKSHTVRSMAQGDSCNTSYWSLPNHIGTHVDYPRHFVDAGLTGDDYQAEDFIFTQIGFVDLGQVPDAAVLGSDDICLDELCPAIDMLVVKTGFSSKRNEPVYWQRNPGFSPHLADHLRDKFPRLRIFGFDSISVSSFAHRDIGRTAHRAFLEHERPLLLLEDMDLSALGKNTSLTRVIVAPLRVNKADGSPCTVMVEIKDGK